MHVVKFPRSDADCQDGKKSSLDRVALRINLRNPTERLARTSRDLQCWVTCSIFIHDILSADVSLLPLDIRWLLGRYWDFSRAIHARFRDR